MEPNRIHSKLVVQKLSNNIREAGQIVSEVLKSPARGQILVKNYYAGVNAIDMNIITGRSKLFSGSLPFDLGMEVFCRLCLLFRYHSLMLSSRVLV